MLTLEQYQSLTSNAKRCGLTKRAFLVRLRERKEVKERPSQEIEDLRTEIHHIRNDIDQIARSVNAGIAKAEDVRRSLHLLDQVYELMYQESPGTLTVQCHLCGTFCVDHCRVKNRQ